MNTANNARSPQQIDNRLLFGMMIKDLKKSLPSACTFLAPFMTSVGEHRVLAKINGDEYQYTVPQDLSFTSADIEELRNVIIEVCE